MPRKSATQRLKEIAAEREAAEKKQEQGTTQPKWRKPKKPKDEYPPPLPKNPLGLTRCDIGGGPRNGGFHFDGCEPPAEAVQPDAEGRHQCPRCNQRFAVAVRCHTCEKLLTPDFHLDASSATCPACGVDGRDDFVSVEVSA